jgi:hypothetical protein
VGGVFKAQGADAARLKVGQHAHQLEVRRSILEPAISLHAKNIVFVVLLEVGAVNRQVKVCNGLRDYRSP